MKNIRRRQQWVSVCKKYLNQEDFPPLKKVCNAIETATKTHKPKIHAHFGRASGSSQPLFLCNLCFSRVGRVGRGGSKRGDEYRSVTLEATTPGIVAARRQNSNMTWQACGHLRLQYTPVISDTRCLYSYSISIVFVLLTKYLVSTFVVFSQSVQMF